MRPPWECLGFLDVAPLAAWLAGARPHWPALPCATKPQRIEAPAELTRPLIRRALDLLGGHDLAEHRTVLSRMTPGQSHPMHVDRQRSDWVTRVHVVVTTCEGCWMQFEGFDPVRFEVGRAYTFDTTHRHAFGNDGDADRVHLLFDVLRRPPS